MSAVEVVASDLTGVTYKLTTASLNGKEGSLSVNGKEAAKATGSDYAFDFKVPVATGVTVIDKNTVQIQFSEKIDATTVTSAAITAGNVTVQKSSDASSVTLSNPVLSADGKTLTVTTTTDLTLADYIATFNNIKDVKGNLIIAASELTFKPTVEQVSTVAAAELVKAAYNTVTGEVAVTFNKAVTTVDVKKLSVNTVALTDADVVTLNAAGTLATIKLSTASQTAINALEGALTLNAAKEAYASGDVKSAAGSVAIVASAPASVASAAYSQEKDQLTVTFDKPVTLEAGKSFTVSDNTGSVTVATSTAVTATGTAATLTTAATTWTFALGANASTLEALNNQNLKVVLPADVVKNEAAVLNATNQATYATGVKVEYTKDETKPTISSIEYNNNTGKLTVKFSEKVTAQANLLLVIDNAATPTADAITLTNNELTGTNDTFVVTLAAGDQTKIDNLYKSGKAIKATINDKIKDTNNLDIEAVAFTKGIEVVYKDFKAPVITNTALDQDVKAIAKNKVSVKFSEKVDAATANVAANYEIKDTTNTALEVTKAELQADGVTVILTTAAQTEGMKYTATVKNVTDVQKNVIANTTATFTGSATAVTAALKVSSVAFDAVQGDKDTITVKFSADVDQTTATNIANYVVLAKGADAEYADAKSFSLTGATAKIDATDKKKVVITLGDNSHLQYGKEYKLFVSNVQDVFDNALSTVAADKEVKQTVIGDASLTTPAAVAYNNPTETTVVLTYKEELNKETAEKATNYTIAGKNVTRAVYTAYDATTKESKVTLTLGAGQTLDNGTVVAIAGVTDLAGNKADGPVTATLVDGIKPTVASVVGKTTTGANNDTIEVKFSENVRSADATKLENYSISFNGGQTIQLKDAKLANAITYNAGTNTATIDLTTTAGSGLSYDLLKATNGLTVNVSNVRDLAGNVIDATSKVGNIESDGVAATVSSATVTSPYTVNVTFSEALLASSVSASDFALKVAADSTAVKVKDVEVNGAVVTLTTETPLTAGTDYTVANAATGALVLDLSGEETKTWSETATITGKTTVTTATTVVTAGDDNAASTINNANKDAVGVTVVTGASLSPSDVIKVTLTDKNGVKVSKSVTATAAASNSVTGIDASTLADGNVAISVEILFGDGFTVAGTGTSATKDTTPATISALTVTPGAAPGTAATASLTASATGTYYYVVLPAADVAPTAATIKGQTAATIKGTAPYTTAATAQSISITGLTAATAYVLYAVVEDAVGNLSVVEAKPFTAGPAV